MIKKNKFKRKGKTMELLKLSFEENTLTAKLSGDLDHHGASAVRELIDDEMYRVRPDTLNLDLGDVEFMDSSGLGLILGRFTKASEIGTGVIISNPSQRTRRLLTLVGVDKMINITEVENK